MQNVLVQTLLPEPLGVEVKRLAKAEGISVSAWLRRLVGMQIGSPRIWKTPPNERKKRSRR